MNLHATILATGLSLMVGGNPIIADYARPRGFATEAATNGMAEVKLAKVAWRKTQNAAVKAWAAALRRDHSDANAELAAIAAIQSLALPSTLTGSQKTVVRTVRTQSGAAFDHAYITETLRNHEQALALFQDAAAKNTNAQLRAFAQKTLPIIERQLEEAEQIDRDLTRMEQAHAAENPRKVQHSSASEPSYTDLASKPGADGGGRGTAGDAPPAPQLLEVIPITD